jgi:hypothetical protein
MLRLSFKRHVIERIQFEDHREHDQEKQLKEPFLCLMRVVSNQQTSSSKDEDLRSRHFGGIEANGRRNIFYYSNHQHAVRARSHHEREVLLTDSARMRDYFITMTRLKFSPASQRFAQIEQCSVELKAESSKNSKPQAQSRPADSISQSQILPLARTKRKLPSMRV